jgi:hypothetical protein
MRLIGNFLVITSLLALGGCATGVSTPETVRETSQFTDGAVINKQKKAKGTDFEVVKSKVKFKHDPHIGTRTATAPQIKYKDAERNKWLDGYNIYNLIGFDVGVSGADTVAFSDVQLRIRQTTQGDWPFYNAAYSAGERLDFTRVDSDVSCLSSVCYKTEIVGINMTVDQLKKLSEKPFFAVKVVGKRNNMIVEIPQSYIKGFLAAIDGK